MNESDTSVPWLPAHNLGHWLAAANNNKGNHRFGSIWGGSYSMVCYRARVLRIHG
eukprot:COSAG01_NODE_2415_length_7736_cov_42.301034_7_plen_55_part_00